MPIYSIDMSEPADEGAVEAVAKAVLDVLKDREKRYGSFLAAASSSEVLFDGGIDLHEIARAAIAGYRAARPDDDIAAERKRAEGMRRRALKLADEWDSMSRKTTGLLSFHASALRTALSSPNPTLEVDDG